LKRAFSRRRIISWIVYKLTKSREEENGIFGETRPPPKIQPEPAIYAVEKHRRDSRKSFDLRKEIGSIEHPGR